MSRAYRSLAALGCAAVLTFLGAPSPRADDAKPAAPKPPAPADIPHLINQLGSDNFDAREAASRALDELGEPALEALRKAASGRADAEVRRRAADILAAVKARRCFNGYEGNVHSVAFSPTGCFFFSIKATYQGTRLIR